MILRDVDPVHEVSWNPYKTTLLTGALSEGRETRAGGNPIISRDTNLIPQNT